MPLRGTLICAAFTVKGSCYYSSHPVFSLHYAARLAAYIIQLLYRHGVGMRGYLHNAVRRSIYNNSAQRTLFITQSVNNLSAGGGSITKHRAPGNLGYPAYYFLRKTARKQRKRLLQHLSHHLPMPRCGILARRYLGRSCIKRAAAASCRPCDFSRLLAPVYVKKPHAGKIFKPCARLHTA